MRIVIDGRESGTTTGRYVDKLIEHLYRLKSGHEIIILTKKHRLEYIAQIAPDFQTIESNFKEFTFSEQLGLAWQLYRLKPDLVHFPMPQQPVIYFGKKVTTFNDLTTIRFRNPAKNRLVFKFKQLVYRWVIRQAARRSRRAIAISEYVRRDLANFAKIDTGRITKIFLAADKIEDEPEIYEKLKGKRYLMYVGRPLPHKNLKRLVRAFIKVREKHHNLHLAFVGKHDWHFQQLKGYVAQSKAEAVIFTDFVADPQLRWLYEHAEAYVFPALSEGFGLPGLEAMNYGVPVVSSYATCLPEVYKNAAEYFDPMDVDDMVAEINKVLGSPELAGKLVANGQKLIKTYSWDKCAQETLEVYNQALGT